MVRLNTLRCSVLLVLFTAAVAGAATKDYIVWNDKLEIGRLAMEGDEAADGAIVSYTAFDSTEYPQMTQYNGKHVKFLIQPEMVGPDRYPLSRVRKDIDRLDFIYAHFLELMGREPARPGLVPVAFVKTCGLGCGFVGLKGVEMDPDLLGAEHVANGIDDLLYWVGVHELTHNFDFYTPFIMFGSDIHHSWTDFMDPYIAVYAHEPLHGFETAQDWAQHWVERSFQPYLDHPDSNWLNCVHEDACDPEGAMGKATQGGMTLTLALLHGPRAVRSAIRFVRDAIVERGLIAPEMDDFARNDLLLEAFANGAKADLSCYIDEWR